MKARTAEISELVKVAHAAADAASVQTLALFRSASLRADNKSGDAGFDPVTQADRAAERAIREVILAARPRDAIEGEEEATRTGTSGLTWVVDPIDGTRAFMSGLPTWGTLIAVGDATGPILGLVDQPYIGERFVGAPNIARMTRSGHRATDLAVRACSDLGAATLYSTFPEIGTASERAAFDAVSAKVRLTRFGCDCYAYALLAMGQIDLVIEAGLNAYDIQAPMAVVEAAGGIVTDWSGGSARHGGRVLAAGSPQIHGAALEILSAHV